MDNLVEMLKNELKGWQSLAKEHVNIIKNQKRELSLLNKRYESLKSDMLALERQIDEYSMWPNK